MAELQDNMPPGWDCKQDLRSGNYYYINHYTKTTTWEDPRLRHRPLQATPKKHFTNVQTEYIQLQHGSPDLRRNYVYPSQPSPIPAFQMPSHMSPKSVPLQDMRPRMSPLTVRSSKVQDSTLTNLTDTNLADEAVAKISVMFPTVSETHIRFLLRKYHNREALVISALQVEKHPITTPGPYATPPPQRNIGGASHGPLHVTPPLGLRAASRGGSPIIRPGSGSSSGHAGSPRIGDGYRSSPRPHSSPKLKLRYMKSIFPQADEMIILDILQNNDNNIQKASESLKDMGYNKKDAVKVAQDKLDAKKEEEERKEEEEKAARSPPPQIKIKTTEEKKQIRADLQEKYKEVAEHLITIALESVSYDESRANQILQIMIQENTQAADHKKKEEEDEIKVVESSDPLNLPSTSSSNIPISQSRQSLKSLLKCEKDKEKSTFSRVIEENDANYRSINLASTMGPNPVHAKGANEKLLLEDYVKWQGSNTSIKRGPQTLARGANASLLSNRTYQPCGSNSDMRKGPKFGLAQGSIFSQLKTVVVGESRGN